MQEIVQKSLFVCICYLHGEVATGAAQFGQIHAADVAATQASDELEMVQTHSSISVPELLYGLPPHVIRRLAVRLAVARFPAKNLNLVEQEEEDISQRVAASKQESTQEKELEQAERERERERERENVCVVCVFYLNSSMWLMIGGGSVASCFLVGVLFSRSDAAAAASAPVAFGMNLEV